LYHIKNDKRSRQSAKLIFSAFNSLLSEKKYTDIKITEVIERAQVSRATFYRNYDTLEDILKYECDQKFIALKDYINSYYLEHNTESSTHPLYLLKPFLRFWYLDSNVIELLIKINNKEILFDNIANMVEKLLNIVNSYDEREPFFEYSVNIRSNIIMGILEVWVSNGKNIAPDDLNIQVIKHIAKSMKFKVDL
jgi:AcrR family transcriptional regulator